MAKYRKLEPEALFVGEDEQVYGLRSEGELPKRKPVFKLIDLFCGAGGMTLGFTEEFGHHFRPVWAKSLPNFRASVRLAGV